MNGLGTGFASVSVADAGFDDNALRGAIQFALAHESTMDRDIGAALHEGHFGEPFPIGNIIGPTKPRGGPSGLILRGGKQVTSWGDTTRSDMTFSISKSYLALLTGIAVDDGLIPDIHAPVRDLIDDGGFDSAQNRDISWAHLLQLTSEWQGTLWDKPDWIDHYRDLDATGERPPVGTKRPLQKPGKFWEYNDVRVNRLALSLLHVFQRALPEVLQERIMDPISASDKWEWHGYSNSWINIGGHQVQSVSGGAHWGGGLWISTQDHARVGQLMLNQGSWQGRQILSSDWIAACLCPCDLNPHYGYLWWLNTDRGTFPAASSASVFAIGVGTNLVWIDPDRDLVVVARWIEKAYVNDFIAAVMAAMTS